MLEKNFPKYGYAKAGLYYVMANIIGQGIVLLSSAVFTRMMDKASYGLMSTYSTWVLVLNTFICLNLFITVRNAYIDFTEDYGRYTSSVLLLSIITGIGCTVLIVILNGMWMNMPTAEVLLACVQSVALNVVNYELAIQSMQNRYRARAALLIAPNWTHTILSVVLMSIFTGNLYMAKIAGNAFGMLIFAVLCAGAVFKRYRPVIDKKYWRYSLKISVPSIFHTLSELILMQSDRLMLTSLAGAEETAEYTVVYNVGSIVLAVYQAINGAWIPWFFERAGQDDHKMTRKYQARYIGIFTAFSCGMMTVSPEFIRLIAPKDYWDGIQYVPAIIIASYLIFLYAFFSCYLMYRKHAGKVARNTILAAGMNLALNVKLIQAYRSKGAVMATVVSYLFLFCLHYFSAGKEGRRFFSFAAIRGGILAMAVYGVLSYCIRDYWIARYLVYAVTLGISAVICKGRICGLADLKKNKKGDVG